VGVAQLMRREPPAHARLGGEPRQFGPHPGARPEAAAGRAVDDAEQRSGRQLDARGEPGLQLLPAPGVHADLAPTAALAAAHEQRTSPRVEVALAQRERLLDAQPAAPEHDDQRPKAGAVAIVGGLAHHGDDLLHARRVSRIQLPLVPRRATGVIARHGRGRSTPNRRRRARWRRSWDPLPIAQRPEPAALPALTHVVNDHVGDLRPLARLWRYESQRLPGQVPDARPQRDCRRRRDHGCRCSIWMQEHRSRVGDSARRSFDDPSRSAIRTLRGDGERIGDETPARSCWTSERMSVCNAPA
jgi:hypothetical protein